MAGKMYTSDQFLETGETMCREKRGSNLRMRETVRIKIREMDPRRTSDARFRSVELLSSTNNFHNEDDMEKKNKENFKHKRRSFPSFGWSEWESSLSGTINKCHVDGETDAEFRITISTCGLPLTD